MATAAFDENARTKPFVCGAIGRWTGERVHLLTTSAPPTEVAYESPSCVVRASPSSRLHGKRSGASRSYSWGFGRADRPQTRDWNVVTDGELNAGVTIEGDVAVLRSCAYGLEDVFGVLQDGALYFSSSIEPLLALLDGKAHTDWGAWANIVALGYPLGSETPFEEVKRLPFSSAWQATRDGELRLLELEPPWESIGRSRATPAEIAEIIRRSIERTFLRRPHVTLSGGWDSRLLAAVVDRRSLRTPVAWTTSTDDGSDVDLTLSLPVARGLGLDHRLVVPPETADVYTASVVEAHHRTEFQTWMHPWLIPLATRVRRDARGAPLYDGLAGDVLLKSLYVGEEVLASPASSRWRTVWTSLTAGAGLDDDRIYAEKASRFIQQHSEESFEQATRRLRGHPFEPTLDVLLTRTMRGIALSPARLFGPECDVRLPFLSPDLVRAALATPIEDKLSGDYYREILQVAGPSVANLPSTNDPVEKQDPRPRRQALPESLRWIAQQIVRSSDAVALISPSIQPKLDHPEQLVDLTKYSRPLRLLQTATLFARWQSTYSDKLSDVGQSPWR